MKINFQTILLTATLIALGSASLTHAQMPTREWYVENFSTKIELTQDSQALITEAITANCPECYGKHGIFRVIPKIVRTASDKKPLYIKLESITDQTGQAYAYTESKFGQTLTWKIGDPDKEVSGKNIYVIKYRAKNVVLNNELNWNVTGNYWDMPIESSQAEIIYPEPVKDKINPVVYYGPVGSLQTLPVTWLNEKAITIKSGLLNPGEGITINATHPDGFFTPYQPNAWENFQKLIHYLWFVFPLAALYLGYSTWNKFGRDPKIKSAIVPEFEIPQKFSPLMLDGIMNYGNITPKGVTAMIIYYATKGYIKIKEIPKIFMKPRDFQFDLIKPLDKLPESIEKRFIAELFADGQTVMSKDLVDFFKYRLTNLNDPLRKHLITEGYLDGQSGWGQYFLKIIIPVVAFFGLYLIQDDTDPLAFVMAGLSVAILVLFGLLLPRRTTQGAQFLQRIKGLKMYMDTAERYRQPFFEKENIYEYFLPYAVLFGIANMWNNKMKKLMGKDYSNYHPAWYAGTAGSFNADNFSSSMNSVISQVNSSVASASSSATGGGSGGGGGGGGGGGW